MINSWNKSYQKKSYAAGSRTNGRWSDGAQTTSTIGATVYPAELKDLEVLEEGLRVRAAIVVFTSVLLKTTDISTGIKADKIVFENDDYEVMKVYQRTRMMPHYKAICVRVEKDAR